MNVKKNLLTFYTAFFRDNQQAALFLLLLAATFSLTALVAGRMAMNGTLVGLTWSLPKLFHLRGGTFLFLLWNLFLAWIPYLAALAFEGSQRKNASLPFLGALFCFWLVFFPNAPYIVTDLVHFHHRPPVPVWYDLTLLFGSACTGLVLGLLSLYEIHGAISRLSHPRLAWLVSTTAILLGGFGIWLGRFQRWNSWDVVYNPLALAHDIAVNLTHPPGLVRAAGITMLLSGVMFIGFLLVQVMLGKAKTNS